jgi:hypothetical protein
MNISSFPSLSALVGDLGSNRVGRSSTADFFESILGNKTPVRSAPKSTSTTENTSDLASFGLGELEGLARSAQAFRFEASQTEWQISGNSFQAQGITQSARFEAILQTEDQTLKFTLEVEKTVVGIAYQSARDGNDPLAETFSKLLDDLNSNAENNASNDRTRDEFLRPQAAADRLAQLALELSNDFNSENSSSDQRSSNFEQFLRSIQPAIDEGFQRAEDLLGPLPDNIKESIDQARGFLNDVLASFFDDRSLAENAPAIDGTSIRGASSASL